MPLVAFSVRLDRIDESLLFQAKDGSFWLSCVCTFEQDAKGRLIVAQSISKERLASGEKGPQVGYWREIGKPASKHDASQTRFDLAKFKQPSPPRDSGRETADGQAFDAAQHQPQGDIKPHGFEELGF